MLYAACIFWTLGYDTIYALQDTEDDALIGVKSTARLFGAAARQWVLRFYAVGFTLILAAGFTEHTGWPFAFRHAAGRRASALAGQSAGHRRSANCLKLFRSNRETGALIAWPSCWRAGWGEPETAIANRRLPGERRSV